MNQNKQLLALALCGLVSVAQAGEKEELLKLRNTTVNLIKQLVKQGVLTEKVAADMIKQAEENATAETASAVAQTPASPAKDTTPPEAGEVRVPYVPEFVKDEIRQQVRTELRADVVKDVMQEAKTQQWGMPNALPEWTKRFTLSGDMRLRSQTEFAGDGNYDQYPSYQNINQPNNVSDATLASSNGVLNTTRNRQRFRERFRLGIDAKISDNFKAGLRLATSNLRDPVSTNQTMGNSGGQYQFAIDRAFLKYDATNADGFKWLTLTGGRIANPWYVGGGEFTAGSELVWDTDLSFEGFAATERFRLGGSDDFDSLKDDSRSMFVTLGAFPLEEAAMASHSKWLFGGQVGLDWKFSNQNALRAGVAYYDYQNIKASSYPATNSSCLGNYPNSNLSIPQWMQTGNSTALICGAGYDNARYGLAANYKILNVNASYDMAMFAPYHVVLGADFAKNIGYSANDVRSARSLSPQGDLLYGNSTKEMTNAWQVRVDIGWPKVEQFGNWNVFTLYKYVERDAVLDAYTDSDFHLGGTNAKGWVIGANYGLMKGVWLTTRWLSTDSITGYKYSNDVLQVDINTRF